MPIRLISLACVLSFMPLISLGHAETSASDRASASSHNETINKGAASPEAPSPPGTANEEVINKQVISILRKFVKAFDDPRDENPFKELYQYTLMKEFHAHNPACDKLFKGAANSLKRASNSHLVNLLDDLCKAKNARCAFKGDKDYVFQEFNGNIYDVIVKIVSCNEKSTDEYEIEIAVPRSEPILSARRIYTFEDMIPNADVRDRLFLGNDFENVTREDNIYEAGKNINCHQNKVYYRDTGRLRNDDKSWLDSNDKNKGRAEKHSVTRVNAPLLILCGNTVYADVTYNQEIYLKEMFRAVEKKMLLNRSKVDVIKVKDKRKLLDIQRAIEINYGCSKKANDRCLKVDACDNSKGGNACPANDINEKEASEATGQQESTSQIKNERDTGVPYTELQIGDARIILVDKSILINAGRAQLQEIRTVVEKMLYD